MDRAELRDHLNHLDALVPALRASSHDRSDFMHTFAGMTRAIEAKAINAQDAEFVERRVNEFWSGTDFKAPTKDPEVVLGASSCAAL